MIKILDISNIKVVGINKKFGAKCMLVKKRWSARLFLAKEYREFKKLIELSARDKKIKPPFKLIMITEMYADIDAPIKVVLDGLEKKLGNDRDVLNLDARKILIKRGAVGQLRVYADTMINQCRECGADKGHEEICIKCGEICS